MVNAFSGFLPLVPPIATSEPRTLLQQRPGRAREPHMGEEFQRIAVLPVGVGQREEIAALGGAGIVDQNVEPAELAPHRLDQRLRRLRRRADRARHTAALRPLPRIDCCHIIERGRVARGKQEVAALLGERQRNAAADAAARSGHQRGLSPQSQLHRALLLPRAPRDNCRRLYRIGGCGDEEVSVRLETVAAAPGRRGPISSFPRSAFSACGQAPRRTARAQDNRHHRVVHRLETLAQNFHAADRRQRGLGRTGGDQRARCFHRCGDNLVECDALRRAQGSQSGTWRPAAPSARHRARHRTS